MQSMDGPGPLTALADPTRRSIFELLAGEGPRAVGELAHRLPVSRPAVSQHLKVLAAAGLVSVSPEGTRRIYSVDPAGIEALRRWLDARWDAVLDRFESAARKEAIAMSVGTKIPPVVKTRTLPIPPEAAFDLFTARMAEWWPTDTHAIRAGEVADVRFEGRVGGRVVEVAADGAEHVWADVLAWDPPRRLVLSWHPSAEPVAASRLEVRFRPADAGTELLLEHGGWEEFGERGTGLREEYDAGWEPVLARLGDAAAR